MEIIKTELPEVLIVAPQVFADHRGTLHEAFSARRFAAAGIDLPFVQQNHTFSRVGVIRGLHYQLGAPQCKLISVVQGRILDVAVDVRRGSPNFAKHVAVTLSGEDKRQLYIPPGFAHGFCALQPATVFYLLSAYYEPAQDRGISFKDPQIGIEWPEPDPLLSPRDLEHPLLSEIDPEELPRYSG